MESFDYFGVEAWVLIALWAAVVVLGGTLCAYAVRAARRSGDRSMLLLGAGFALLALATAVEWLVVWFTLDDLFVAALGCTALMAAGFGVILVALKMRLG